MSGALKLVATGVIVAALSAFLLMNGILGVPHGPDQPPVVGGSAPETSVRPTATAPDRSATPSSDPSPSPLAPTSSPGLDTLASEVFDWTRIDLPREAGVWNSIATLPTGEILLLGRRGREHVPYGWLSTDGGRTWHRHGIGADFDHEPDQLVAWDDMFVIAGGVKGTGVVLTSTDGVTWTTAAEVERADFYDLEVLPDGLAILGRTRESGKDDRRWIREAALFTSTDATSWETHRLPDPNADTSGGIARSDAGVSLVSSHNSGENGMLLRSEDGDTWTPIDLPVPPGTGGYVRASALAWAPSGFVLALYRDTGPRTYSAGSLWHSNDGVSWERVADTDAPVSRINADDRSLVAFPGPYRSTDGRDWTTVAGFDGPSLVSATLTADGRVLALVRLTGTDYAVVFGDPT